MCANSCRYYYGSSSPSFPDLSPPRDMPQPHKTISRKIQQFSEDPDSIEFCLDDEPTVSARYFKNGHCRHKTYDPQVRWSRNNIAVTMERFQPITSPSSTSESSSYTSHQDCKSTISFYEIFPFCCMQCHIHLPIVNNFPYLASLTNFSSV